MIEEIILYSANIDVSMFIRFFPPDDFNLALLNLELEFVKKGTNEEQVWPYF